MELSRTLAGAGVRGVERRIGTYAVALVLAEVLVVAVDPRLGALLHALLLVVLLQHGARSDVVPEQRLYWSLATVPVLRLLSLALPLGLFPGAWRYAAVAVPLLAAVLVAARATDLRPRDIGLSVSLRALPLQAVVGLLGLPLGVLEYQLLKPAPLVTELSPSAVWAPALVLLLATGFTEEVLFRGLLQRTSSDLLGPWLGPALVTLLWTALHLGIGSWPAVGLTLVAGGLFALVAGWTGSIWGVCVAHGLTNVVLFLVAPFLFNPLNPLAT